MSGSSFTLARLESATAEWQRQIDLDARIARTRADIPLLDAEANRTRQPFAASNAAAARAHLTRLEQERACLGDPAAGYEAAAAAREAEVRADARPAGDRLADIAREQGRLHAALREVREAIDAGRVAASALSELHQVLEELWRVSIVDSTLLSNPLVDLDKYARVRRANEMLPVVNTALHSFSREIADVAANVSFPPLWPLDISGVATALDVLNTIGVESHVSLRVSRATTQAHQALTAVQQHLWSLEQRHAGYQATVHALAAERHDLLRGTPGE